MYEPMCLEQLPLDNFVKKYETKLPQVVVLHESIYGCASTLKDGELLEVHFKKESPVITMKMTPGLSYTVPVNSSFKFSYLYNPHNNLVKAREGYVFKTVGDLMKAVPLPNIVYVGKECKTADKKRTIKKGQILHIKGVESRIGKSKLLKCCIINETEDIYIKESCEGQFSTKESLLLFPLSVLLKMKLQWPITTSVYDSTGAHLHIRFNKRSALLYNNQTIMESLVASSNNEYSVQTHLTEIRTTLPFEVHIAILSFAAMSRLNQKTLTLSHTLAPDMIHTVVYDVSPTENTLQRDLLSPLNNESWIHEVKAIDASSIYEPMTFGNDYFIPKEERPPPVPSRDHRRHSSNPKSTKRHSLASLPSSRPHSQSVNIMTSTDSDDEYIYVGRHKARPKSISMSHVITDNPSYGLSHTNTQSDIIVPTEIPTTPSDATSICTDISYMSIKESDISSISGTSLNDSTVDMLNTSAETYEAPVKTQEQYLEFNKSILSAYDTPQVVNLLGIMGLVQYAHKFEEEFITGGLLFELDEDILKEELGMTKKLHRLRLMMIIKGTQCVSNYIKDFQ